LSLLTGSWRGFPKDEETTTVTFALVMPGSHGYKEIQEGEGWGHLSLPKKLRFLKAKTRLRTRSCTYNLEWVSSTNPIITLSHYPSPSAALNSWRFIAPDIQHAPCNFKTIM